MGLVFFYALIAGYELGWIWAHRTRKDGDVSPASPRWCPWRPCRSASTLLSPLAPLPAEIEFLPLADKTRDLVFPFVNYVLPLDIATACAVGAFLLGCIAKGYCRMTQAPALL